MAAAQIVVTPVQPPQASASESEAESEDAGALLAQARAAAQEARSSSLAPSPDQAGWRNAIRLGEAARDGAPEDEEVLRFLAETYSTVAWDSRAWEAWGAYLDAGGELDEAALVAMSEAGRKLGYARFAAGELGGAAEVFERVLELDPQNVETVTWLGRIALEQGHSEAAVGYWERVLELKPGDATARYYLAQSREQLTYGADALSAFNEGLTAYNEGRAAAALDAFSRAAEANPEFEQAASRAGRTALELGRPQTARRFLNMLLARNPEDQQAAYLLTLADAQEAWGTGSRKRLLRRAGAVQPGPGGGGRRTIYRGERRQPGVSGGRHLGCAQPSGVRAGGAGHPLLGTGSRAQSGRRYGAVFFGGSSGAKGYRGGGGRSAFNEGCQSVRRSRSQCGPSCLSGRQPNENPPTPKPGAGSGVWRSRGDVTLRRERRMSGH